MKNMRLKMKTAILMVAGLSAMAPLSKAAEASRGDTAIAASSFPGGVVVAIDDNPRVLQQIIEKRPNSLGHLLVEDEPTADAGRATVARANLHGKIAVSVWDGSTLPFIPDFINLLIAPAASAPEKSEILRALAPGGKSYIAGNITEKPRPAGMDDWPMAMYGADGNAVSKDKIKPPLVHMPWVGGPRWSRHHESMSSIAACISSDGRVFYIIDEGSLFSPYLPARWKLVARDAFNGTILWKLPIKKWYGNLYRYKGGPATVTRRVVGQDNKVYATLGIDAPVSEIDGASGKILGTLKGTDNTEEIICTNGFLYLVADPAENKPELDPKVRGARFWKGKHWYRRKKEIICYDLKHDRISWKNEFPWVAPHTLAVSRNKVYFSDGSCVLALSGNDGNLLWKSGKMPTLGDKDGLMPTGFGPKLVVKSGVLMYAGGEGWKAGVGSIGKLFGLSLEDGKILWTAKHNASGFASPKDLFVTRGKAWSANVTSAKSPRTRSGEAVGINVGSGEQGKVIDPVDAFWFHHRCHPGKSTEDYMLLSRTGIEFVDYETGEWSLHHWARGACTVGIIPANNMLYCPQHPCGCYPMAKVYGFSALAGHSPGYSALKRLPDNRRLQTISAAPPAVEAEPREDIWPAFRRDNMRRSSVNKKIAMPKAVVWEAAPGGKLTAPVAAGGKVVVSVRDNPAVIAYDARTGAPAWTFYPGAQVDSPPTLAENMVYFGSADGMVHCLRLSDGRRVWRYHAAPTAARNMFMERLESSHPVHGSVLVQDGKVYVTAGRMNFVEGGIHFIILDAKTGRKLKEHVYGDKDNEGGPLNLRHEILSAPAATADILSSNGKKVFMAFQGFDMEGKRLDLPFSRNYYGEEEAGSFRGRQLNRSLKRLDVENQRGEDAHLFSITGFMDETWWHRTYLMFGKVSAGGWHGFSAAGAKGAPAGRAISFDRDNIFSWGRIRLMFKWSREYVYTLKKHSMDFDHRWEYRLPILVRSMLLSKDKIYAFGPKESLMQSRISADSNPETNKRLLEQEEALDGKRGSYLLQISKSDGTMTAGAKLPFAVVLTGAVSAYGKFYLSCTDGRLFCLGNSGEPLTQVGKQEMDGFIARANVPDSMKNKEYKNPQWKVEDYRKVPKEELNRQHQESRDGLKKALQDLNEQDKQLGTE